MINMNQCKGDNQAYPLKRNETIFDVFSTFQS
jgi:hypothetical protein